jgi:hypothetical protein
MMYDKSDIAKEARQITPVFLGLWHPAKQASLLIMKRFASTFLAPLMHHLQPDSHYYLKPQLTKITKFLVMIRLAYDQVSDAFRKVKEAHMTTPGQRGLVASIIELVERYIVTVSAL